MKKINFAKCIKKIGIFRLIIITVFILIMCNYINDLLYINRYENYIGKEINTIFHMTVDDMTAIETDLKSILDNKKINESQYHNLYFGYEQFKNSMQKSVEYVKIINPYEYKKSPCLRVERCQYPLVEMEFYLFKLRERINFSNYNVSFFIEKPLETQLNKEDLEKLTVVYEATKTFKKIISENYGDSSFVTVKKGEWIYIIKEIHKYVGDNIYLKFHK